MRGRFGQRLPDRTGPVGGARGGRDAEDAPSLEHKVGRRAVALDGALVDRGREPHRAAQLDDELVELRCPGVLPEKQGLVGERGDGHALLAGEAVAFGDQHAQRVEPDQLGGHTRGRQGRPADADVQAAVGQLLVLLGCADLHLVDGQPRMALLDRAQDLRHRVVAGVDDARTQGGRGRGGGAGRLDGPADVVEDLAGLHQERRPGGGELDVVGAAVQQPHLQLALQTLHLLAQRGLHDVLARRGPAEMELLGQGDEVTELA